jgi:hypothetical protein
MYYRQESLPRPNLDRIFEPENLVNLQQSNDKSSLVYHRYPTCDKLIAVPMVYISANRLAAE